MKFRSIIFILLFALSLPVFATEPNRDALACMTQNVYYEGRGENTEGKFAIAQVTLNRAKREPTKVCAIVHARKQFSWTIKPTGAKELEAWREAQVIAYLSFFMADFTDGADHYHAISIYPDWAPSMEMKGQWGAHLFYRARSKR